MKNKLFWIIVTLVIIGGGWYWYSGRESTAPLLSADVYPLYSGAMWETASATTSPEYGQVVRLDSEPFVDVTDIAAVSTPFTTYYRAKLTAAGWTSDMSREAGGPGAEISVYTKGDQFVVVMFRSLFKVTHPDAPSECPCDVTLSLMSGT